jgi:23S rRNA (uracil1939-C5)-methyltransferase
MSGAPDAPRDATRVFRRGEELTLRLESPELEGKNVARLDGLVVFVLGGVPGDLVRLRLTKVKKQFLEGEMLEILEPSPIRTAPRCAHFGECGGCRWQDVRYDAQLEFKRRHVQDALERIGGFEGVPVHPTLPSERVYEYRNKMEYSFGRQWLSREDYAAQKETAETDASLLALGLHHRGRFDRVLDVRECHLQPDAGSRIVNLVRDWCRSRNLTAYSTRTHTGYLRHLVVRGSVRSPGLMVNLVTSEDRPALMEELAEALRRGVPRITTFVNNITARKSQVALGETERVVFGPGWITESIGGASYRVSANSFFQTNTLQAERLYDTAAVLADLRPDDVLWDLYSGTGTIALHLAARVREVVGIEAVDAAVADARANAERLGAANCTFVPGDLKERLTRDTGWAAGRPGPTVVVTDPPRAGMHEKVVMELVKLSPGRIVYVSCNPATMARDLRLLCTGGGYAVAEVHPVDMFPHTSHVECVARVLRTNAATPLPA